jgi:inosose dehydratase
VPPPAERVAGAPISWGVCEVPGWGPALPPTTVLSELASLGLRATELGPPGYLGRDPATQTARLEAFGLEPVGRFLPLVLHRGSEADLDRLLEPELAELEAIGAGVVILAAVASVDWAVPGSLSVEEWDALVRGLGWARARIEERGLRMALHPHLGTLVSEAETIERVLSDSDLPWCLDPGHLELGGADALDLLARYGGRVSHVHLKDVDRGVARAVREGRLSLRAACERGLFPVLGAGDARIAKIIAALDRRGYAGPLVIEQDRVPSGGRGASPTPRQEMARSLRFLDSLRPVGRGVSMA